MMRAVLERYEAKILDKVDRREKTRTQKHQ